jgi:hypothetical protein
MRLNEADRRTSRVSPTTRAQQHRIAVFCPGHLVLLALLVHISIHDNKRGTPGCRPEKLCGFFGFFKVCGSCFRYHVYRLPRLESCAGRISGGAIGRGGKRSAAVACGLLRATNLLDRTTLSQLDITRTRKPD